MKLEEILCMWKKVSEDKITLSKDKKCFDCTGINSSCETYINSTGTSDVGDICQGQMSQVYGEFDIDHCYLKDFKCKYRVNHYEISRHCPTKVCNYDKGGMK
jgi:hypothetical protein